MDKEFLMDYKARESDEITKFLQNYCERKIKREDRYPPSERLKLNEPYTRSVVGKDFWSQIPIYGTTVIILKPVNKMIFKEVHGFDAEDIDILMDFAKETGRIRFTLDYDEEPICYRNLDFLEPIFMDSELKPPQLLSIPLKAIIDEDEIARASTELKPLIENPNVQSFIRSYIKEKYDASIHAEEDVKQGIINDLIKLKLAGHEDLVKDFTQGLISIGPIRISFLLHAIHDIFFFAYDPLEGIRSFKRQNLAELYKRFPYGRIFYEGREFPCEVGKFLCGKLKLITVKNIDGAVKLSDKYESNDLIKVMNAFNEGVEKEQPDVINDNLEELFTIFNNVWNEANKLKRDKDFGSVISLAIATVGHIASSTSSLSLNKEEGILEGLGLKSSKVMATPKISESLAGKTANWLPPSHVFHIYEFKEKYNLITFWDILKRDWDRLKRTF